MGAYCSLTGFALHSHMEKAEERDLRKVGGSGWLFEAFSTLHLVSLIDVHCRFRKQQKEKKILFDIYDVVFTPSMI